MLKSIRSKITITYLVLIVTILSIVSLFLHISLERYNQENLKNELIKQSILISEMLAKDIKNDEFSKDKIINLSHKLKFNISLLDLDGNIIFNTDKEKVITKYSILSPELDGAIKKGIGTDLRKNKNSNKESNLYVGSLVSVDNIPKAILRISVSLSQVNKIPVEINRLLLLSVVLAALAAIVLSISFARRLTEPLQEIAGVAKRVQQGDFSQKIIPRTNDEIGKLGVVINEMSNTIQEKVKQLSFAKQRLETILNNIVSSIILVNKKGDILLVNPSAEKLFDVKEIECIGKNNLVVIRNYVLNEKIKETLIKNKAIDLEIQIMYPEEKTIQAYFAPINKGKEKNVLIMLHDITTIKQAEKIRTEFVANASHELRSPLTAIKGFSETLLSGALEDMETSKRFINIINQESERLSRIVQDLLELSRIESKRLKMLKNKVNIKNLAEDIQLDLEQRLEKSNLTIYVDIDQDAKFIIGDRDWLHQVLLNLIDNSIKYTPYGGCIKIIGESLEHENIYKIIDTGMGISKEDLPRIFERFYRVDKARSRQMGGTGLGLSIVKHIIERHYGEIGIESVLGKGTTIWFILPKYKDTDK